MIARLWRNLALTCGAMAMGAAVVTRDARMVAGVVAGGVLVALALWALGGLVGALGRGGENGQKRPFSRAFSLVKFFTRHVILALVAYVMMVRLHLDPIGMVVGVTAVVVAAAIEAARSR